MSNSGYRDRDGDGRADAYDPIDDRDRTDGPSDRNRLVDHDQDGLVDPRPVADQAADNRERVVEREQEAFGGIKIGAAFFGWLSAMGMAVLLTALIAATGAAIGLGNIEDLDEAADAAGQNFETVGIIGAVLLVLVMLVAYYCGGYVAGRMSRFNGSRQGLAVWLWSLAIAIVVALLGLAFGSRFDIFANVNVFPRIPLSEGELTAGSIITAVLLLVASLVGAILGGIAGTRYHRRVDRAGFGA